ncbi:hypothetical protein [Actinoallomurus rhizosphaericola]|uniref:hypothetical protein n=1 Tax=Actinoallomurus rhizosphaericola TaxID=2952536 RepID=UPI0020914B2C|nr:hypothetical protein [Actinoallomurus rhizosphaericola]MCO5994405.1 hypothetical protein [Actinoallomurus rhizosphaericola]
MDGHELAEVAGAIGIFTFITTVITVIIVQVGATVRARAALAREEEYRRLAESGVETQQSIERQLTEAGRRLAAMEERMSSLEKILQTVE